MSVNLEYNYARVNLETGECIVCRTYSYEIPLPEYILVPVHTNDYRGKFYDFETELWYIDAEKTILWEDAPQW